MIAVTTLVPITAHVEEIREDGEISRLNMTDEKLVDQHIIEYASRISRDHENVSVIHFNSNITIVGLRALEKMFFHPFQVNVFVGKIRFEEMQWLAGIVGDPCCSLTILDIELSFRDLEHFYMLAQALSTSRRIVKLKIQMGTQPGNWRDHLIYDRFSKELAALLIHNKSIRWMYLSRFPFQNDHIEVIGEGLKQNSTLTLLDMWGRNTINDVGCLSIVTALKVNTTLTSLTLTGNIQNPDPWTDMIRSNPIIEKIGLYGDPMIFESNHPALNGVMINRMRKSKIKSSLMATGLTNPKVRTSLFKRLLWQT